MFIIIQLKRGHKEFNWRKELTNNRVRKADMPLIESIKKKK